MSKHLTFSNLHTIGINPLTGEACAFSMRILCDVNDKGAELVKDFLGLPVGTKLADAWNREVNCYPAIGSIMVERGLFPSLARFALFRSGFQ